MKTCRQCKIEKEYEQFYKCSRTKGGRRSKCIDCMKIVNASVPSRTKEGQAKYRDENREAIRENSRRYEEKMRREHGSGWRNDYRRWYYQENKDRINERRNAWLSDTGKGVEYIERRRALKQAAHGDFTAEDFQRLVDYLGGFCLSCGSYDKLTPDHIIPLSRGGSNCISNIQPLCRSCNCSKGASIVDYRF